MCDCINTLHGPALRRREDGEDAAEGQDDGPGLGCLTPDASWTKHILCRYAYLLFCCKCMLIVAFLG